MKKQRWARGITDIKLVTDLGSTPASVDRETGVVYINNKLRSRISPDKWLFILLHELGHLVLQTSDEKEVDAWAFDQYARQGGKLSESVHALTKVLNFSSTEHLERANLQLRRAQLFDKTYNPHHYEKENKKTKRRRNQQENWPTKEGLQMGERPQGRSYQSEIEKINGMKLSKTTVTPAGDLNFDGHESFLGIDFSNVGDKLTNTFNDIGSIATSGRAAVDAFRNPTSGQTYTPPVDYSKSSESSVIDIRGLLDKANNTPKKDDTMMYFGIGAGVLVLVVVLMMVMKK